MTGQPSQNTPFRRLRALAQGRRRLSGTLAGLALLGGGLMAIDWLAHTEVGHLLAIGLGQLADPESWRR